MLWRVRRDRLDVIAAAILVATVAAFAGWVLATYYRDPGELWRSLEHDRHGHYLAAVNLAASVRTLDPISFFFHLDKLRFYPPLFSLLMTPVLVAHNFDIRFAVLPALLGWSATVVLTAVIARRLFADRLQGYVAGAVAASFALASPGFRALGADVMLETCGAALTALVLALYLRWRSAPHDPARMRHAALALTFLFFLKGNYWLLTAASMAIAYAIEGRAEWIAFARAHLDATTLARFVRKAATDPLLILAALLAATTAGVLLHGPTALTILGLRVSLYPPENLLTITWVVLFIRLAIAWRRHRQALETLLPKPALALFYWHVVPVAVYLLVPKRLPALVNIVSPANAGVGQPFDPWRGLQFYAGVLAESFQVAPWSAILAGALVIVAALRLRRLAPGAIAVAVLFAVSACAAMVHPNTQGRYMASWIFTFWILAGTGAAVLIGALPLRRAARASMAALAVAVLMLAQLMTTPSPNAAVRVSHFTHEPRDLDLIAAYRERLAHVGVVGIASTIGDAQAFAWPLRAQCGCLAEVDLARLPIIFGTKAELHAAMLDWVGRTRAERIAVIDLLDRAPIPKLGWTREAMSGIHEAMTAQDRFSLMESIEVSSYPARIEIWQRRR